MPRIFCILYWLPCEFHSIQELLLVLLYLYFLFSQVLNLLLMWYPEVNLNYYGKTKREEEMQILSLFQEAPVTKIDNINDKIRPYSIEYSNIEDMLTWFTIIQYGYHSHTLLKVCYNLSDTYLHVYVPTDRSYIDNPGDTFFLNKQF